MWSTYCMQAVSWRPEIIEPQPRWDEVIISVLVRGTRLRYSPDLPGSHGWRWQSWG